MRERAGHSLRMGLAIGAGVVASAAYPASAQETFSLPLGQMNTAAAPFMDMILDTIPQTGMLSTWGERGAAGLQGSLSEYPNGSGYVNDPAATVAFKFNIGAAVDSLNAKYGAGNWTILNPTLTMQYTFYANNPIFGGGAGSFETYWIANNNWAFGDGASSGNEFGDNDYVSGVDPIYATNSSTLQSWAGSVADLGSTTYGWLSPANNPNYSSWMTAKSGANQGLITDQLGRSSAFLSAIRSASAIDNDPYISFYLIPTSNSLGLTIFTGGGNQTPEFSFDVITTTPIPEPVSMTVLGGISTFTLMRRPRRA